MPQQQPVSFALALAAVSFLLTVVWGQPLINELKRRGIGKKIHIEEPGVHQVKTGTPTMGGILFLVPVFIITLVLNLANFLSGSTWGKAILQVFNFAEGSSLIGKSILFPLAGHGGFRLPGRPRRSGGYPRRAQRRPGHASPGSRRRYQTILALIVALRARISCSDIHSVAIPGIRQKIDLGVIYIPIAAFIIVSMTNAVNLTDGLDGLAGATSAIAFTVYGVIAHLQGQYPLMSFCFVMAGALFAFLWYNAYPAQLFMGDLGALALGATLAVVALMTGQWLLLPIVGVVFVAEALSGELAGQLLQVDQAAHGDGQTHLQDDAAALSF